MSVLRLREDDVPFSSANHVPDILLTIFTKVLKFYMPKKWSLGVTKQRAQNDPGSEEQNQAGPCFAAAPEAYAAWSPPQRKAGAINSKLRRPL